MMVNCTQRTFLAKPGKLKIISSDSFAGLEQFNAERVLTRNEDEFGGQWVIAPGQGEFIMDMGSDALVVGVELVNTGESARATRAFTVHLALADSGPWTEILSEELEDPKDDPLPLPLLTFSLPPTVARFIRFRIVSWYGGYGALQYFNPLFPFLGQLNTVMYIVHCITWCCSKANICMPSFTVPCYRRREDHRGMLLQG